ncbi:hypothetical protein OSB04_024578 [Centaurea solstitialis]|uniref:Uncharacterized protein n=1 Tax=Centaurea solstitialis TaxID=347529 RepID=A0AA38SY34_9ASTR|nr:hypothetical protein OSB04_024578 [Centaurea solstitialis]
MLGELITKCLVLILGYAYPDFECFYKAIEKHGDENGELRLLCQYCWPGETLGEVEEMVDMQQTKGKTAIYALTCFYCFVRHTDFIHEDSHLLTLHLQTQSVGKDRKVNCVKWEPRSSLLAASSDDMTTKAVTGHNNQQHHEVIERCLSFVVEENNFPPLGVGNASQQRGHKKNGFKS